MEMILVSACLLGVNCKYDGKNNLNKDITNLQKQYGIVPVCPEQLGGLMTPRLPAEIANGNGIDVLEKRAKVIRNDGIDVTEEFVKGAYETLYIAQCMGINRAIFKAKSPSCGSEKIYDGTFTKTLRDGDGVTVALLKKNGIKVLDENSLLNK